VFGLAQGMLRLTSTPQRELSVVQKAGGFPLALGVLMDTIPVAARRGRELETCWLYARVREEYSRR
jgi:hypothetical protein